MSQQILYCPQVYKEDLDLHNHLVGLKQLFIKLTFLTTSDLQRVRRDLNTAVRKNKERAKAATAYSEMLQQQISTGSKSNPMDLLVDMREHDMPLHVRVSIDKSIFVGSWYDVICKGNSEEPSIVKREDLIERPDSPSAKENSLPCFFSLFTLVSSEFDGK